jgi:hypothetical protein
MYRDLNIELPTPEDMDRVEERKPFFKRGSIVYTQPHIQKGATTNVREDYPHQPLTLRASRTR